MCCDSSKHKCCEQPEKEVEKKDEGCCCAEPVEKDEKGKCCDK